jgi:Protein of unknown function, DUF547
VRLRPFRIGIVRVALVLALVLLPLRMAFAQFDHSHSAWNALVAKHVVLIEGGNASQVRYAGFAQDRAALKAYLDSLSRVTSREFESWTKPQQMAFLINAYNAFTVEKILTRYPDIKSIRDFGRVIGNPFKDSFFVLLGTGSSLDRIEHELLRAKGVYEEPRVHFAVNCASIGCPMLREEAYVAERLDAQLEAQTLRFLSDRSRNRYDPAKNVLEVSKIFDWFKEDWQSGYRGLGKDAAPISSREHFLAKYADVLAATAEGRQAVRERKAALAFLEYDWALNDVRR